jgi:hypothetical protein
MAKASAAFLGALILSLSFACMAAAPAMAESQYLVVSVEPASQGIEIGKVLVVGDTINVPGGVVVTLMGENGSVNKLTGPTAVVVTQDTGAAAANEDNRSTLSKLGELLRSDKSTANRLGVSRSAQAAAKPDPWAVRLDAGTACVRDGVLKLKREKVTGREIALTVEVDGTPSPGGLFWAAGELVFEYPQKLPAGAKTVIVNLEGGASTLAVVHLPATVDPGPSIETLKILNDNGCVDQMLALAKSVAD